jgi:hypothetical protein
VTDKRAEYARLRAVIEVRLAELRAALDGHEADRRCLGELERVESGLAELVEEVGEPCTRRS